MAGERGVAVRETRVGKRLAARVDNMIGQLEQVLLKLSEEEKKELAAKQAAQISGPIAAEILYVYMNVVVSCCFYLAGCTPRVHSPRLFMRPLHR